MTKTIHRKDINNADDLLTFLTKLKNEGHDLTVMWVKDGSGDEFDTAMVHMDKLSDGSMTFDLSLTTED